jgi:hypothetical protein
VRIARQIPQHLPRSAEGRLRINDPLPTWKYGTGRSSCSRASSRALRAWA